MHPIDYPLCFEPLLLEKPWGKTVFPEWLGLSIPKGKRIGEIWLISDREHAQTKVLNGPLAGKTIEQLRRDDPVGFYGPGGQASLRFPLLFKLLLTDEKLSVQVHPDDAYTRKHHPGDSGKIEMWYVLEAEPNACSLVGFKHAMTPERLRAAIENQDLEDRMNSVDMVPDSSIWVPAGRIHGIGAGLVLAEVQENSDLTFRVYDHGRQSKDGSRKLHIAEALQTVDLGDTGDGRLEASLRKRPEGEMSLLAEDEHFWCEHWRCGSTYTNPGHAGFQVLMGVGGSGQVVFPQGYGELSKGTVWLMPAGAREWRVEPEGRVEFLRVWVAA